MSSVEAPQFRLRMDDVFFGVMALIVLVTVLSGFAHTYFLAGMMRAKLPSVLVHLHGAAFSLWIRLYVQTGLVIARRVGTTACLVLPGRCLPPRWWFWGVWRLQR